MPEVQAVRAMVHRSLPWTASPTMPRPAPVGPVRRRERKQQQLRSELLTMPATSNQMLRDINSEAHMAHNSGMVRSANHLAAMPSLEALAALW